MSCFSLPSSPLVRKRGVSNSVRHFVSEGMQGDESLD